MGRLISTYVPGPLQKPALWVVRKIIRLSRKLFNFGFSHFCPVCRSRLRRFGPLVEKSYTSLNSKRCPVCKSLERHRWAWWYLREKTNLFDGTSKKFLHIAPEKEFSNLFQKIPDLDYLSGDLEPGRAMEQMDLTDIHYPDQTFDVIYCSHVLEHIPDDRKAISEMFRVLKKGGWALIHVPIHGKVTYEKAQSQNLEEWLKVRDHPEHVRVCGADYSDRLTQAGFQVATEDSLSYFNNDQIVYYGLKSWPLYLCRKNKLNSTVPDPTSYNPFHNL